MQKLIQRKPMNRLGYMGIKEVKEHPWIKNFSWEDLRMRKIDAPYLPKYSDNFDKKYCEAPDQIGNETQERYHNYYRRDNYLDLFNEYTFYNQEEKEKFNMIINRKHTNSQSLLNQPAHMKKIRHNKYSASIDITSNMKTINTDKFTNNFNNTNKNSFKDTINHNDDVSINRSNNRLKGIHSSNYRSSIISNSKKKSDKLPLILSPSINNSKSKEKFLPFNSINKLKLNKNNILSIKNHKFGTISSSSTGSSLVSLNTLRKKSK